MSEAVSALSGASYDGIVRVADAGLQGMIQLRGNLGKAAVKNAVTGVTGVDFPAARQANVNGERGILWMSPDELLVLVPYAEATQAVETITMALKKEHHLAADVSDARVMFSLEGEGLREVLAKLTPADMSRAGLPVGEMRRTRLAQVAAGVWLESETSARVIAFRSVAHYVMGLLTHSAQPGSEVGHF
ncbi:MAG: sarcosine oxidase subunit gamma [Rhodobacteraceae bacterium]|nr:sarcosine oxidase subunit gamma [Paracoccaceae bacterium]